MTGKCTGKAGRPTDPGKDSSILVAARELLFSEGPQALTMEKVAEKAGVSKMTAYARYPNRHALLQAVVTSEASMIHQALIKQPASKAALVADLNAFLDAAVAFMGSERHKCLMLAVSAIPQDASDLAEVYHNGPENTHAQLAAYLQSATAQGFLDCPAPRDSAEMLIGMSTGLDILRSHYRVPIKPRSVRERKAHVQRVVASFLTLHGVDNSC